MDEETDKTSLLRGYRPQTHSSQPTESAPSYYDSRIQQPSQTTKLFQLAFVIIVVVMVMISFILSIYRSAVLSNGIYVMLGLAMVGFLAIEAIMILFIRSGDLPVEKTWFLYAVGSGIIIECIFTNILLFR